MAKKKANPKLYLFWCVECLSPQSETWLDVMVASEPIPCLKCRGKLTSRTAHPTPEELPDGHFGRAPSSRDKQPEYRKVDESKIRRCYMICVDCRTKFTSDDPPERDGNRMKCSFCGGKIVLEHQLEDYLAEGFF